MAARKKTTRKKTTRKKTAKKKTTRKPGRPTKYTKALAAKICSQLADGKSLRKVCEPASMPSKSTVFLWLANHEVFSDQYARAKAESAEAHADDILDIADDPSLHPNDKRVRIDTRKWLASKLKPKRYGDRLIHQGDEDEPVFTKVQHVIKD